MILTLGGLGVWTFIDWIMVLCGCFKDSEGKIIKADINSIQSQNSNLSNSGQSDDQKLREWHKLYTDGIITKAEYEAKRKSLLGK